MSHKMTGWVTCFIINIFETELYRENTAQDVFILMSSDIANKEIPLANEMFRLK